MVNTVTCSLSVRFCFMFIYIVFQFQVIRRGSFLTPGHHVGDCTVIILACLFVASGSVNALAVVLFLLSLLVIK